MTNETEVGLLAIGNSRVHAEQLFTRTVEVLDRETAREVRREKPMKPTTAVIGREAAIARLRKELIALATSGQSICQIAAERKILCGGFLRYSDQQLRQRYATIVAADPSISRQELERKANEWQLQQQRESGTLVCCDTQWRKYETCHGWDDFSNEELAQFCLEICGQGVIVTGEKALPVI